ncbi:hypothetical protein [Novosphingobium sp.]|uniref:hypothetical protein n=1 Tax=Novosphingobium sp. TaxID=1874826 RepID=UPI002FDABBC9
MYSEPDFLTDSRKSKRFRLSLQFVAELTQMEQNPEGLSAIYHLYRDDISRSLTALRQLNIITLPFGLETTTEMHMQILLGAAYQMASDKDLSVTVATAAPRQSLALTAGLVDSDDEDGAEA